MTRTRGRKHSKDLLDISRIARLHRCKISLRTRSATPPLKNVLWANRDRVPRGFYSARNNRYFNLERRRSILKPNFTDETFRIYIIIHNGVQLSPLRQLLFHSPFPDILFHLFRSHFRKNYSCLVSAEGHFHCR